MEMKKRFWKVLSVLGCFLLLFVGYYFLNCKYGFGIPCIFYELTGFKCPGCGTTRALFALLEGELGTAFRYNKLIFLVWPFLILYILYRSYLYVLGEEMRSNIKNIAKYGFALLLIITLFYGILRNVL